MEEKVVRKVRTQRGVNRYDQPIGSIIVRDGEPPLSHLTLGDSSYERWDRVRGDNGKQYDVGYDEENETWVATGADNWDDVVVDDAKNEEEVYRLLDESIGGKRRKGQTRLGSNSKYDTERDRQAGRKRLTKDRDAAKEKYGDRRKKNDYDKYVSAHIVNFDKAVKDGNWAQAEVELGNVFDAIRAKNRRDSLKGREREQQDQRRQQDKERTSKSVRERAKQLAEERDESPAVIAGRRRAEREDRMRRERLQKRVDALSKYTEQGQDYDRDISNMVSRYHEAMSNDKPEQAEIALGHAEQRALARQNAGMVQRRNEREKRVPKHGEVGSTVGIDGLSVEIVEPLHRGEDGSMQLAFDYENREYEVSLPKRDGDSSGEVVITDAATGETESEPLPKSSEAGDTPKARSETTNRGIASALRRLSKRVAGKGDKDEQRKETLNAGSNVLSVEGVKPLSAFQNKKYSALRRQYDRSIALNDNEWAQATLDLLDEMFKEHGIKANKGPRSQIRRMRNAAKLMDDSPTLRLEDRMTLGQLKKVESERLVQYRELLSQELAQLGTKKNKSAVQLRALWSENMDRVTRVLSERDKD